MALAFITNAVDMVGLCTPFLAYIDPRHGSMKLYENRTVIPYLNVSYMYRLLDRRIDMG